MDMKIVIYAVVIFAVAVLAWSITTMSNGAKTNPQYQYYNNLQQQSADGCGDLTETGNIQHLSHHPDQYSECIKKVDPQKFKEAVGGDRDNFLKSKGL
ncbi:MAG: hypothetical protein HY512_00870 [Candidatus Aenigmarchaeota archaeon]|nr:hypothetical protein [Candidatus Aenigmarchaeota archaeon]